MEVGEPEPDDAAPAAQGVAAASAAGGAADVPAASDLSASPAADAPQPTAGTATAADGAQQPEAGQKDAAAPDAMRICCAVARCASVTRLSQQWSHMQLMALWKCCHLLYCMWNCVGYLGQTEQWKRKEMEGNQ